MAFHTYYACLCYMGRIFNRKDNNICHKSFYPMKYLPDIFREHERNIDNISMEFLQYRCYGDAKMAKPKILKGLNPVKTFGRAFGNNKTCRKLHVYDIGRGSLCLYFGSLFSRYHAFPEAIDAELPSSVLARKYDLGRNINGHFVYADAWCTIYDRNEGYVIINGLVACFNELFGIHISPIVERVYSCLRDLSLKDYRFMSLRMQPVDMDSAMYFRVCSDLVEWMYIDHKNKNRWNHV